MTKDVQGTNAATASENRCQRVLMLARNNTDSPGGVVTFLRTAVSHLSPAWQVEWFAIGQRAGVRSTAATVLQPLRDACRLFMKLRRERFAVVHVNPSFAVRSLLRDALFMLVMRLSRVGNCLVFFHGWDAQLAERVRKSFVLRQGFLMTFGAANKIIVLSPTFRDQLGAIGVNTDRVDVMTTMFDGQLFANENEEKSKDAKGILFLSRLEPQKGVNTLIESFESIMNDFPAAELVLAGDGSLRESVLKRPAVQQHEERIRVPGFVEGEQKSRLLLDASIFVLPTRHAEGCPVAVLEAMAAGLPVVATRVGAIPMIVKHGQNGFLLDELTVESLADALSRLLTDEDLRERMGQLNKQQAWERYEASRVTRELEAKYRTVCLQTSPPVAGVLEIGDAERRR